MEIWMVGLPATVALGAVALIGYLFGQRSRPAVSSLGGAQLHQELKRAQSIVRDLETIAQQVRRDLARHQGSLGKFRTRLRYLCEVGESPASLLASETDQMLEPTEQLTARLTQAYEMIRKQADQLTSFRSLRTDPLTGLGNRQALEARLGTLIEMQQQCGLICSLAMFDIDLLQHVNDEQGRSQGDNILKQVGQLLDHYARESDVVCRYGGEEFVVVLPGTGLAGATSFAERMRATIERLTSVTVSCGVAEALTGDNAANWLSRADAALYSAKVAGRNRVYQHTGVTVCPPPPEERRLELRLPKRHDFPPHDDAVRETLRSVSETLRELPRPKLLSAEPKTASVGMPKHG
jgi:diguanylate cyclase (GGDEF)-like protein